MISTSSWITRIKAMLLLAMVAYVGIYSAEQAGWAKCNSDVNSCESCPLESSKNPAKPLSDHDCLKTCHHHGTILPSSCAIRFVGCDLLQSFSLQAALVPDGPVFDIDHPPQLG
jgi:hypothetical protein